jgi:carbon starvation protein
MLLMLAMPAWAMAYKIVTDWSRNDYLLLGFGGVILGLQVWMVIEAWVAWPAARGILEPELPPAVPRPASAVGGGRRGG